MLKLRTATWTALTPARTQPSRWASKRASGKEQPRLWPSADFEGFAVGSWYQVEHRGQPFPASVTNLLQRVSQHEDSIVTEIMKAMEELPPIADDLAESLEDLGVAPPVGCPESDCCMDTDSPPHCQTSRSACGANGDAWSSSCARGAIFSQLLQSCRDIVAELGLPLGLLEHINELEKI
ncbi:OTU deubiquitinase with linear linkage specificity a isoform X3 [Vanacampus margaritifer]